MNQLSSKFRIVTVSLAVIITFGVYGCKGDRPTKNSTPVVRVASLPYLSFSPLYIAEEKGFFAQEGLSVEFIRFQRNGDSLPALLAGKIDVDSIFTVGMLNAIAKGEKIRVVTSRGIARETCPADGFFFRRGLEHKMKNPKPEFLRSLTFGVDPAWLDSYFLNTVLTGFGLSLNDVKTVYIPDPAARVDALKTGALDVGFFSEPWVGRAKKQNAGVMWKSVASIYPDHPLGILIFGPALLNDQSRNSIGVRFLRAYLKGVRQFNDGKTPQNLDMVSKVTHLDKNLLNSICWTSFDPDGMLDAETLVRYAAWARERGHVDQALTRETIWDPRFIQAAKESLDEKK